jgi:predicted metal-dependent hydrolase
MYDPRFLAGIQYFNECDFYEAHEVWEELWTEYQGPSRRFYQGLIQVAVCLHHFGNGNTRGAKKLYFTSRKYLEDFRPHHEGIDLDRLFSELERCCAGIVETEDEIPAVEIVPDLIPEIELDPPATDEIANTS